MDVEDPSIRRQADDDRRRHGDAIQPGLRKIASASAKPGHFEDASRAWFKLTHRDMGRRRATSVPDVPAGRPDLAGPGAVATKPTTRAVSEAGSPPPACRSANGDHRLGQRPHLPRLGLRGGANGARIRWPAKDWEGNEPARLAKVLAAYEDRRRDQRIDRT